VASEPSPRPSSGRRRCSWRLTRHVPSSS
jgi:hypothetical protein